MEFRILWLFILIFVSIYIYSLHRNKKINTRYNINYIKYTIIVILICLVTVVDKKIGNEMLNELMSFSRSMIIIYVSGDVIWGIVCYKIKKISTSELLIVENFYAMLHVFIGLFIVGIFYPPVFAISIIGIVILVFILGFLIYSIEEKLFQKVIEIFKNIIERVKGSRK